MLKGSNQLSVVIQVSGGTTEYPSGVVTLEGYEIIDFNFSDYESWNVLQ